MKVMRTREPLVPFFQLQPEINVFNGFWEWNYERGVSKEGLSAHTLFGGNVASDLDFIFSLTSLCQIIRSLHLEPSIRRTSECLLQADGHFRRNPHPPEEEPSEEHPLLQR